LSLAPLIGPFNLILNLLFLVEQDLLDSPVLYLSRAIIQRKLDYYRLLRSVTSEGRWEDWILYMLNAVDETARWTTAKIRAIRELMQTTAEYVREKAPAVYRRELVELIFVQPYCRIANVVEADIAKRQTASVYLKELCDVGVLKEIKIGREKLFINPRLMTLLTAERDDAVPGFAKRRGEVKIRRVVIPLSMVTRLAPARLAAIMMGIWFTANAIANYLGHTESLLAGSSIPLYWFLVGSSLGAGVLLLLITPLLKYLMHGKG
jgi:hypothetical protein